MNDIIMHVNYGEITFNHFGKNSIDDVCKLASETGFNGIEFRYNPPVELSDYSYEEYITEISRCKKKHGLKRIILCMNMPDASDPLKEKREQNINNILERVKIANDLCQSDIFNTYAKEIKSSDTSVPSDSYEFHGSYSATDKDWELTVESFKILGEKLSSLGVKFAFETHMNYIHDIPSSTIKLVNLIDSPSIGINMDYGNTVYFPDQPDVEKTIEIYKNKLFYTHLKNSNPVPVSLKRFPCALSEGEINHRIYLKKLKEIGYKGPIGIEAPRPGDREWYALCDFNYAKKLIEEIF